MFPEFSAALGDPPGDEILTTILEEDPGVASFAIHHFISQKLKRKNKVLLVGLDQSLGHYHAVATKLGHNLIKLQDQKEFIFYEGLKTLLETSLGKCTAFDFINEDFTMDSLKPFYQHIKNIFLQMMGDGTRGCCIVIDNLTVLLSLGASVESLEYLVSQFLRLVKGSGGSVVLKLDNWEGDSDSARLANLIHRLSAVNVSVKGLKTGQSRDVSGCLRIEVLQMDRGDFCTRDYQFWVEDRNVKVFAPGTSAAVL